MSELNIKSEIKGAIIAFIIMIGVVLILLLMIAGLATVFGRW